KLLAVKLQISFFDTGALYRALAWFVIDQKIKWEAITESLPLFVFSIQEHEGNKEYFVSNKNVTQEIRKKEITEMASKIAAIKEVRAALLPMQKEYAQKGDFVFEGRDLGTVVFPEAEVKIFLTARADIRAERRYKEMIEKDPTLNIKLQDVLEASEKRDAQDSNREIAPLKCPEGAFVLDTSDLTIPQVIETLYQHVLTKKKSCKAG
ncbi:MAG: (d)CMP kinase, partial [Verrucomicrobia bacterium]|nr:(d)CMP kinase [Verrucomicrobiota bacterium]